jgi:uncharacterized protein YndB with AHSA1/START domain
MIIDPKLDLVLERVVDVSPELVWLAWTRPEHLKQWFTPAPWSTVECEIDLRPGGVFRTLMRSPEGEEHPNFGCYLEIVPNRKLVWTDALEAGFRPSRHAAQHLGFRHTAVLSLEPQGEGTKYTVLAMHRDEAARRKHDEMGFQDGWGTALAQLVLYMKSQRG